MNFLSTMLWVVCVVGGGYLGSFIISKFLRGSLKAEDIYARYGQWIGRGVMFILFLILLFFADRCG